MVFGAGGASTEGYLVRNHPPFWYTDGSGGKYATSITNFSPPNTATFYVFCLTLTTLDPFYYQSNVPVTCIRLVVALPHVHVLYSQTKNDVAERVLVRLKDWATALGVENSHQQFWSNMKLIQEPKQLLPRFVLISQNTLQPLVVDPNTIPSPVSWRLRRLVRHVSLQFEPHHQLQLPVSGATGVPRMHRGWKESLCLGFRHHQKEQYSYCTTVFTYASPETQPGQASSLKECWWLKPPCGEKPREQDQTRGRLWSEREARKTRLYEEEEETAQGEKKCGEQGNEEFTERVCAARAEQRKREGGSLNVRFLMACVRWSLCLLPDSSVAVFLQV